MITLGLTDYSLVYQDGEKTEIINCKDVRELDSCISGIEMDNGRVISVQDRNGKYVTATEIGSHQTEAF